MQKEANVELEKMISNGGRVKKEKKPDLQLNSISTDKRDEVLNSVRSVKSSVRHESTTRNGHNNNSTFRQKSSV